MNPLCFWLHWFSLHTYASAKTLDSYAKKTPPQAPQMRPLQSAVQYIEQLGRCWCLLPRSISHSEATQPSICFEVWLESLTQISLSAKWDLQTVITWSNQNQLSPEQLNTLLFSWVTFPCQIWTFNPHCSSYAAILQVRLNSNGIFNLFWLKYSWAWKKKAKMKTKWKQNEIGEKWNK